jgi:hypothetical protein
MRLTEKQRHELARLKLDLDFAEEFANDARYFIDQNREQIQNLQQEKQIWLDYDRSLIKIESERLDQIKENLEGLRDYGATLNQEFIDFRHELSEAQQKFNAARRQFFFDEADEAYHKSLAGFVKIGAAAALPIIAWSIYGEHREFPPAFLALLSYAFALSFLVIEFDANHGAAKLSRMEKFDDDPRFVQWARGYDIARSLVVWLQWVTLLVAGAGVFKYSFDWG